MENKNNGSFILIILATIIGVALFKQFDFEALKFKKLGISIIYLITFSGLLYFIIRGKKNVNKEI